ncbi:MAG: C69 family dipeptidase [Bacteroides sp.]|nr:C69 family dipeptidase [Roseburia sp.]MCM1345967.1 C69 family dipeptidase [Bacteroides sp.]MCM1420904.1 C69 family dipeptidase [Bacteroides sp.]
MKKIFLSASMFAAINVFACTNLIVGKDASADGSVIVSYNADSYGMYGNLYRHVGGKHASGEKRKVYDWDTNKYLGEIPQASQTYNVVGQMNENQVTITETTFGGREELADSTGILDYGSLIYIALERATSARHAIKIMTDLVSQYGYYSEGETFTIADKNEVWVMEMIGKGPGVTGAVWVAVRIPDDCICAHANQSRITTFNMKDKRNVMYAKDVVKFARQKGYFTGKDTDFSFRDAYCPLNFGNIRYCDARAWSFFNKYADGMDKYLPYINGEDMKLEMPLYMKPNRKLTVQDVQNGMRDHYEDTPLDIRNDLGAGAYNMPYRPSPLSYKVDEKDYYNERPISTQQTAFSFVGQMRSDMPDAIGGVVWWTNDDANMTAYTPIYCCAASVPECYERIAGKQDDVTFSWNSAFWLCNTVSNMVYPYYSKMMPDLVAARDELENGFFASQQNMENIAKSIYENNPKGAVELLTSYGLETASKMMNRWQLLFQYLVVKHNDMVVKKEKEGKFEKTPYGYCVPVDRPGYSANYWKKVADETGERYRLK